MVMKNTKHKHLLRTIRKSGVSFFAVAFIAATSIAIFVGMQSSGQTLLHTADRYFQTNHLATWEIACANGITQEDIDAIASWEDISAVEGGYSDTALLEKDYEKTSIRVLSLGERLNLPTVLEGHLPEAVNEVAIEELMAKERDLQVGDTITLENDGFLQRDTFTVTAIVNQPSYSCSKVLDARGKGDAGLGANEFYVMVHLEAFDTSYYSDCFTTAYVDSAALDGIYYFSSAYTQAEEPLRQALEVHAQEQAQVRYDSLKAEAQEKIDDAKGELAQAQAEIQDGEAQIAQSQQELDDSLAQLQAQLAALALPTDLEQAQGQLELLGPTGEPLLQGIEAWKEGEAQLVESQSQLEDARTQVEEGQAELADAQSQLEDLRLEEWIISGRNEMGDVRGIETIVGSIYGLSATLPVIFLVVATVVCYAAITRMIDEQRVMVGTQKALGFTPKEILKHYMTYNTLCAILGILIGWLASVVIVEVVVLNVYRDQLSLGTVPWGFAWGPALIAALLCVVLFLASTYIACSKLVKVPATMLLRGEIPEKKKNFFFEKWAPYQKLNLYSRTMIKNVLNDKGRMLTTISGLMGCVALLIISFSIKFSNEDSSVVQFNRYFFYDNRLVFDSGEGSAEEYSQVLEDNGVDYTLIQDRLENFRVDGGDWDNAHVITVADGQKLSDFIFLQDISTKKTAEIPEDGMLVSRKCAEMLDLKAGSTVEIMDENGKAISFTIAGVVEHYLPYHLFVTSDSYWESVMGAAPDREVFLLNGDVTGVKEQVQDLPGFLFLRDNSDYDADASSINGVIYVCLALSVVMVLLVLMNQIVMYINRKARELAVMRVNGYTMGQTKAYIYKDNIVLTALGLVFGCLVGIGVSYIVIRIIETGASRYVRDPNGLACLLACLIVAVMAFLVNLIALRKINRLNLTNVSGN